MVNRNGKSGETHRTRQTRDIGVRVPHVGDRGDEAHLQQNNIGKDCICADQEWSQEEASEEKEDI